MAIANVSRPAAFNEDSGRFEQTYVAKNADGTISKRTKVVEDIQFYRTASTDFFYDNSLIKISNLEYSTSYNFSSSTLNVFLNGLNISNDITIKSKGFFLESSYEDIIDEHAVIFATYIKA